MNLKTGTLVRLGVTFSGLVVLLLALAHVVVSDAFDELEHHFAEQNLARVRAGLENQSDELLAKLGDWALWDDTYRFADDSNAQYIEANLLCGSLETLAVSSIIISNTDNKLVHQVVCNVDEVTGVEIRRIFLESIHRRAAELPDGISGIVNIERQTYFVAARQILTSSGDGPPRGIISFFKPLTDENRDSIARLSLTHLEFRIAETASESDFPEASDTSWPTAQSLPPEGLVDRSITNQVSCFGTITDLYGRPALIARASTERLISSLGRRVVLYFVVGLLVAGAVYGVVSAMTLARTVLSRVTRLGREVALIGQAGDLAKRVSGSNAKDELGMLAAEVNRMLQTAERTQTTVRESENRLRNVIETAGSVIVGLGTDRAVVHWNREAETVFTLARGTAAGLDFVSRFVEPSSRGRAADSIARALAGHVVRGVEYGVLGAGRTARTLLWNLAPENDGAGRCIGVIAIGQDITDRSRTEQELISRSCELENAREAADAANRAKSEFLANMSHEIRTPMTAILGFADLISDEELPTQTRHSHVETIRRNGEHLLSIINDILDLSKIEAGHMGIEHIPCSPIAIVDEVIALVAERAATKGLYLRSETTFPVPSTIRTDPVRLRQVLVNLIGNAVKFTGEGGVTVRTSFVSGTSVSGMSTPPQLRFDVIDTGIGLTPEQRGRLFQAFSQADASTTRQFGGTGLGLVISRRLATLLGGEIRLESELGKGSTFTTMIATGELDGIDMLHSPAPARTIAPARASRRSGLQGRVLLAEDGVDNQRLITFHLKKFGLEVDLAENGRQAVEKIIAAQQSGTPHDLVILDMQMPVLDGYGAARELRAFGIAVPIIAATAHAMPEDRERCLKAGCTDYITKPIVPSKLFETCERWLSGPDAKPEAKADAKPEAKADAKADVMPARSPSN